MDKLKDLTAVEKKSYRMAIYSDRLAGLTLRCPEDGTWMTATGNMFMYAKSSHWMVEYLCPKDKELINIWTPELDALTKQIAKGVLEKQT